MGSYLGLVGFLGVFCEFDYRVLLERNKVSSHVGGCWIGK